MTCSRMYGVHTQLEKEITTMTRDKPEHVSKPMCIRTSIESHESAHVDVRCFFLTPPHDLWILTERNMQTCDVSGSANLVCMLMIHKDFQLLSFVKKVTANSVNHVQHCRTRRMQRFTSGLHTVHHICRSRLETEKTPRTVRKMGDHTKVSVLRWWLVLQLTEDSLD